MRKKMLIFAALILAFSNVGVLASTQYTNAKDKPEKEEKVKIIICHRHNSVTNPYNQESVDIDSVDGEGKSDHTSHDGPLAASLEIATALKDDKKDWGDIIPPISDNDYDGMNWTEVGQAMYDNDCEYVTVVVPAAVEFDDAYCDEKTGYYTIPETEGVEYFVNDSETPTEAGKYEVTSNQTVTITAKAASSEYLILSATKHEWSHEFEIPTVEECTQGAQSVTPAAVIFTTPTCSVLGFYTVPTTEGVKYYVNSIVVAAGKHTMNNGVTVTVTAIADDGVELKEGATNQWTYTFTAPTNCGGSGSVLGDSTTLPNTSANSTGFVAAIASIVIAASTMLGAFIRRLLTR